MTSPCAILWLPGAGRECLWSPHKGGPEGDLRGKSRCSRSCKAERFTWCQVLAHLIFVRDIRDISVEKICHVKKSQISVCNKCGDIRNSSTPSCHVEKYKISWYICEFVLLAIFEVNYSGGLLSPISFLQTSGFDAPQWIDVQWINWVVQFSKVKWSEVLIQWSLVLSQWCKMAP